MFRGEDEDLLENAGQGVAIGKQMISKGSIMENIVSRVATVQSVNNAGVAGASGENTAGGLNMEAEKSIKDILDERKQQLEDLEQL